MPSPETFDVARGLSDDLPLRVVDAAGNYYGPNETPQQDSPFLVDDPLSARLWAGDDQAPVLTKTPTWTDVTTAAYKIAFSDADTAALTPGLYRCIVTVARSGRTAPVGDFLVRITEAPGTASAPVAFTVFGDLTKYAPWIDDLQAQTDQFGFAEQQARASSRMVDALTNLYKPGMVGRHPTSLGPSQYLTGVVGDAGAFWFRQQLVPLAPLGTAPAALPNRQTTAGNFVQSRVSTALLLYDEVLEICAKWALAYVCEAQVGRDSDKDWWALAKFFRGDANGLFFSRKFEVDLSVPQTGYASVTIDGGSTSLR